MVKKIFTFLEWHDSLHYLKRIKKCKNEIEGNPLMQFFSKSEWINSEQMSTKITNSQINLVKLRKTRKIFFFADIICFRFRFQPFTSPDHKFCKRFQLLVVFSIYTAIFWNRSQIVPKQLTFLSYFTKLILPMQTFLCRTFRVISQTLFNLLFWSVLACNTNCLSVFDHFCGVGAWRLKTLLNTYDEFSYENN